MRAIVTVVGKDKIGIIAKVCTVLAEHDVNVLDISQTILHDYFNMIMIVEYQEGTFEGVYENLKKTGEALGVEIRVQREEIFEAMHRV
ncbi:hypothetical protein AOC36_00740 [Erysipelothrix larvae]|uniref:UPF0237 protein AOC36_00740 n=1 Tax=Erysipelothrix larvae TaxID=1514105 RepID=A0A0X8GY47_9FIRM|nr:ACT domain-containing protein [Erysipelothrix larvae]AMC92570.1 hypothetical protein AOC36_00740 [Erysipelothrix larvae]